FRKLLVRGVGRLLGRTFPGSTSASALFRHGAVEAHMIKCDTLVAGRVLHEVEGETKRVIQLKGLFARKSLVLSAEIVDGFRGRNSTGFSNECGDSIVR